jgi:hypothetical protein
MTLLMGNVGCLVLMCVRVRIEKIDGVSDKMIEKGRSAEKPGKDEK